MKKIAIIVVAFIGIIIITTGFTINKTDAPKSYPKEECLQNPRELIAQMFVRHENIKGIDTYYLMMINTTGKGMCLHLTYKNKDFYGYVPAWANSRENAVYIYFSKEKIDKNEILYKRDHSDVICPKMSTSQY
ncbi:MAG: hypothetical protein IJT39_05445 [Bacteroidales bacterium]|nr:hypothetical protein [Bacteroidales bacterium]